jgi:hypothetical protein
MRHRVRPRIRRRWAVVLVLIPLLAPAARSWAREVVQLTDDDTDDENPRIDGSNVVWQRDGDIFLFDGVTTLPVTDDLQEEANPDVSGSRVVWQTFDGFDWEIALWDADTGTVTRSRTTRTWSPPEPAAMRTTGIPRSTAPTWSGPGT